eukprot:TRINITY_DN1439_c0_g2_i2.p1 TRINITY_DN1439_c0_g2~~TRINITY_DN1439_c0_g2_i2.p1  ORF type:complete len:701 (-),score=103.93 TRINITY_DN1439_c0_g2_i2:457-2244(-)
MSSAGLSTTLFARSSSDFCGSDDDEHHDKLERGGLSGAENMATAIADKIINFLKKQLDGMTVAVAKEAERLLESVTDTQLHSSRSATNKLLKCSKASKFPHVLESLEKVVQQHSIESDENPSGPDESTVPMPVWRNELEQPAEGGACSLDQPPLLPSVVEDSVSLRTPPYQLVRQTSPFSKASDCSKKVDLSIEVQREMQRAAVTAGQDGRVAFSMQRSLPKSVAGAWRRQAAILGRQFREQMAEEVAMAKNNVSFHGGLWWLRSITGVGSLPRPKRAVYISACIMLLMTAILSWNLQLAAAVPKGMISSVLDVAMVFSGALGLTIHHACCKLSDNCPTTGEQDAMLQSHSVAFDFTDDWLALSRKRGWWLLLIWLTSIATACASYVYKAQVFSEQSHDWFIVTGSLHFMISSTIVCSLSMRVLHICSAMKISLISFMQQFAEPSVDFYDMVQEWNAIQIFTRTLSDGCAPSSACQVAMIPVMVGSALLQILLTSTSFLDLFVTITPFFVFSGMPYFALVAAADTTMQCEQAAQVANSLLVSQLANPVAQNLLDFMSRCNLGFFINDLRISPAGVMKYTYVLAVVFVTVASSVVR